MVICHGVISEVEGYRASGQDMFLFGSVNIRVGFMRLQ